MRYALTCVGTGLLGCLLALLPVAPVSARTAWINNSDLVPAYVSDAQVRMETSENGTLVSPDWVKSLIVVEVNVAQASDNATFSGMGRTLDHLKEMGVNGIWLTPINDGGHYANYGPHTVNKRLTGKDNYEEGWVVVKQFVDEAHCRNIRVFVDVITWGTHKFSPIYTEHPEWYTGAEAYGGYVWKWSNSSWRAWYADQMINMVVKTGIDGFRCDLEPDNTGHDLFGGVRRHLYDKGIKIAIFSEVSNYRAGAFDFEQIGVGSDETSKKHYIYYPDYFIEHGNIVDCVKTGRGIGHKEQQIQGNGGTARFYSYMVSCHDSVDYAAKGRIQTLGYNAILAPFIPIWFIGEEWNNAYTSNNWAYATKIDWALLEVNRTYFENVKRLIRIRRQNPEIFESFPENHRHANICKVTTDQGGVVQAYARYAGKKGVLVVLNNDTAARRFKITIPYADMGLSSLDNYVLVDLITCRELARGSVSSIPNFHASVETGGLGVYMICDPASLILPVELVTEENESSSSYSSTPERNPLMTQPSIKDGADTFSSSTGSFVPGESSATTPTPSLVPGQIGQTSRLITATADEANPQAGGLSALWLVVIIGGAILVLGAGTIAVLTKLRKIKW